MLEGVSSAGLGGSQISAVGRQIGALGLDRLAAAVTLGGTLVSVVGTLRTVYEAYAAKVAAETARDTAAVAALTASRSVMGPGGWAIIGAAAAAGVAVGAACSYVATQIVGDMRSSGGRTAAAQQAAVTARMG